MSRFASLVVVASLFLLASCRSAVDDSARDSWLEQRGTRAWSCFPLVLARGWEVQSTSREDGQALCRALEEAACSPRVHLEDQPPLEVDHRDPEAVAKALAERLRPEEWFGDRVLYPWVELSGGSPVLGWCLALPDGRVASLGTLDVDHPRYARVVRGELPWRWMAAELTERWGPVPEDLFDRRTVDHHPDGRFKKGLLRGETTVDGRRAYAWLRRYPDGSLRSLCLARSWTFGELELPEDSYLWYAADGSLESVWLGDDLLWRGIPVRGGGKITMSFHPNGAPKAFFLREDHVLDGVPCVASVFHSVVLHPDGRVAECTLAEPLEWAGQLLESGERLVLDRSGRRVERRQP